MSTKAEELDNLIQDWLRTQHADYRCWNDPEFDCMSKSPEIIVAINSVGFLEWRNTDGGLGQVFVETHAHWRRFLDLCEIGYRQIGAVEYASRIKEVRDLFVSFEPIFQDAWDADMDAFQNHSDQSFKHVDAFRRSDFVNATQRPIDAQYCYSDVVVNLRNVWLESHESEIRLAMIQADLKRAEDHLRQVSRSNDCLLQLRELMVRISKLA